MGTALASETQTFMFFGIRESFHADASSNSSQKPTPTLKIIRTQPNVSTSLLAQVSLRFTTTRLGVLMSGVAKLLHNVERALRLPTSSPFPSATPAAVASMAGSHPPKLHGRAFYESIGSPKLILAPMVDRSEFVSTFPPRQKPDSLTENLGMEIAHTVLPG